jgi:cell filamentation protein, protein adenylyltransferase
MKRANFASYSKSSVAGEAVQAYIPEPVPPRIPLDLQEIYPLLDEANLAIGRLDGISITVPDPSLFLYMYVRKEAVLSSQIEGTQSTLTDLLMYENHEAVGVPIDDVIEVSNYVAAMEYGLKKIGSGFPLCLRLLREMHAILLNNGRGGSKQPGEFRRSQNWIGGTRPGNAKFVPPPWERVNELLGDLEKFLHNEKGKMPALIKAALAHVQFETIHPFLDGNGRLGRLLITFVLCVDGLLKQPLLYLSLYFKTNKNKYYDHLQLVRETGDWEEWLVFFLRGVIETANQAVETVQSIVNLINEDKKKIQGIGRGAASTLIVHQLLQAYPVTDSKKIQKKCDLTLPTINAAFKNLMSLNIVEEITGHARNKIYKYHRYLKTMDEGLV